MELLPSGIAEFKRLLYSGKRHGESSFMSVAIAAESVLLADIGVGFKGEIVDINEVQEDLVEVNTIITQTSVKINTKLAILEEAYYKNNNKGNLQSFEVENNNKVAQQYNVAQLHDILWASMRELNKIVMKIAVKYKIDVPFYTNTSSNTQNKIEF